MKRTVASIAIAAAIVLGMDRCSRREMALVIKELPCPCRCDQEQPIEGEPRTDQTAWRQR